MPAELLTAAQAAQRLGIAVTTFYQWLSQSQAGKFLVQGQPLTIHYLQTGAQGQGRIRIEAAEVERLVAAMQARPQIPRARRRPILPQQFPGITVPLGRPDR